jgi:dTDP-4-amino-4,6-dideoxygalactose transaminase
MNWKIPLADVDIGPEEVAAVQKVLQRGWLTMGDETSAFEEAFAQRVNAHQAIALASCTAALHLACLALKLGPGDEVIVPSLSFVATANAVRYTGAIPIFADIVSDIDLNISAEAIADKITPRTRAIIVMHYAGYACDMLAIMEIARLHNLDVIEDAAHAPGAMLENKALGTWGTMGCFSFFSNKNMTTGEGGMIVTNDDALAEQLRYLRSHGMTTVTWDRHQGHAWSYDVVATGYNYRIDEMRSALGRVQLGKLDANNALRERLNAQYVQLLQEKAPEITIPFREHRGRPAYHIRPILLPDGSDRQGFMDSMKQSGIQTSIHYPPIHQFENYRALAEGVYLPVTDVISSREVTLPLYPQMKPGDVNLVVRSCVEALNSL